VSRREERKEIELLEDIEESIEALIIINQGIAASLAALVAALVPFATTGVLSIQGDPAMPNVTLDFSTDSTGATLEPPPPGNASGLVVTFASDGTTTVGASVQGTNATSGFTNYSAPLSVTDDGSVSNLTVTVANADGGELFDADGTTPFVQPAAFAYTAPAPPPAQATTGVLSVA